MKALLFLCLFVSAGAFAQESQCVKDFNNGVQSLNLGNAAKKEVIALIEKANSAKTKDEVCEHAGGATYQATLAAKNYEYAKDSFLAAIVSCQQQSQRVKVQNALKIAIDNYVDAFVNDLNFQKQVEELDCY